MACAALIKFSFCKALKFHFPRLVGLFVRQIERLTKRRSTGNMAKSKKVNGEM